MISFIAPVLEHVGDEAEREHAASELETAIRDIVKNL